MLRSAPGGYEASRVTPEELSRALRMAGGNKSAAARHLSVNISTLRRLMRRYGVSR